VCDSAEERLSSDIVGICTDGASVMTKVGKVVEAKHQLCYAHGVQLAILDVLYHRKLECAYNTTASDASACERDSDDDDDIGDQELGCSGML